MVDGYAMDFLCHGYVTIHKNRPIDCQHFVENPMNNYHFFKKILWMEEIWRNRAPVERWFIIVYHSLSHCL